MQFTRTSTETRKREKKEARLATGARFFIPVGRQWKDRKTRPHCHRGRKRHRSRESQGHGRGRHARGHCRCARGSPEGRAQLFVLQQQSRRLERLKLDVTNRKAYARTAHQVETFGEIMRWSTTPASGRWGAIEKTSTTTGTGACR